MSDRQKRNQKKLNPNQITLLITLLSASERNPFRLSELLNTFPRLFPKDVVLLARDVNIRAGRALIIIAPQKTTFLFHLSEDGKVVAKLEEEKRQLAKLNAAW